MERVRIPDGEYAERAERAAGLVRARGLDALIVNSTEADYANVRYFSGFWPLFERAGVIVSATGGTALMVGPESLMYAANAGKIGKVFQLMAYRESADPSYPEVAPHTFHDAFGAVGLLGSRLKVGLGGYLDTTLPVMDALKSEYPDMEIVRADDIMLALRGVKSPNEIACLREAFRIAEIALDEVLGSLRPGMTELQAVGIAQKSIYDNGAEHEGLPMYVFAGKSSRHAISRPTHNVIRKGDIVQLNISARVDGYSVCVGLPVSMGRLEGRKRDIVEFGMLAHRWTERQLKAGAVASDIASRYIELFKQYGFSDNYLYGPCHGLGMIEVEAPWMESNSGYALASGMTFQIDTFVSSPDFGIRWEKGVAITEGGCENLSSWDVAIREIG